LQAFKIIYSIYEKYTDEKEAERILMEETSKIKTINSSEGYDSDSSISKSKKVVSSEGGSSTTTIVTKKKIIRREESSSSSSEEEKRRKKKKSVVVNPSS
jgi:hypothetical protein